MSIEGKILVVGAGGIGGQVAGCLTSDGHDVVALTTNHEIAAAVSKQGYRLRGQTEERDVPGVIRTELEVGELFDFIVLATQPPQVEEAARGVLAHLSPRGQFVVFQNGLCERRIGDVAGGMDRVIGAVISWGASMPEPGLYERTSLGGFTIGRVEGEVDEACRQIGAALTCVGEVKYTDNLEGARWSKLAINCAVSSLGTLGGQRLGPLLKDQKVRRVAIEVMTEVVQVARTNGVELEKVAGTVDLEWLAVDSPKKRNSKIAWAMRHALLLAIGTKYRRLRSSMLSAIERGRPPAVDFLNGEVVTYAEKQGMSAPVNQKITRWIHELADGTRETGLENLHALLEER